MRISSNLSVGFSCGLALAAVVAATAFAVVPPDSAVPANSQDDVLRGPAVGQDAVKSDRPFVGKGARASGPQLEQRVFFATLDQMKFDEALQAKVSGLRQDFSAKVAAYEKEAGPKRKALEESRKSAAPDQPPSDEVKKSMQALEAARPKLSDVKTQLATMLTPEQLATFQTNYSAEMKRVRADMTKRTAAEREAQKPAAPKDAGNNPQATDDDDADDDMSDDGASDKKKDGKKKDGKKKDGKKKQNEEDDGDDDMDSPKKPSL